MFKIKMSLISVFTFCSFTVNASPLNHSFKTVYGGSHVDYSEDIKNFLKEFDKSTLPAELETGWYAVDCNSTYGPYSRLGVFTVFYFEGKKRMLLLSVDSASLEDLKKLDKETFESIESGNEKYGNQVTPVTVIDNSYTAYLRVAKSKYEVRENADGLIIKSPEVEDSHEHIYSGDHSNSGPNLYACKMIQKIYNY